MMFENIKARKEFSERTLAKLRSVLEKEDIKDGLSVVASGSFARREASELSDLDYFLICDRQEDKADYEPELARIREMLQTVVPNMPSADGAFDRLVSINGMLKNIGGQEDRNDKITRRILLLLEGEWLYNKDTFDECRKKILGRYINKHITDHQLLMFFLNDLIRYYRTVCIDFEYKTTEGDKPWGTRNIKLIFSRKLTYFSGVLVAAESAQLDYQNKIAVTKNLLTMTPINRIQNICGARSDKALQSYDRFLEAISTRAMRDIFDEVTPDRPHRAEFRELKNEGHRFTMALVKLLQDTYEASHPIHKALLM